MIQLTVWGGAGEHGRSSYLLQHNDEAVLLDCGVKKEGTGEYPLIEPERVPHLKAVFLSHAHEDHCIALPMLYKHGYRGKIYTTRSTAEQLPDYFNSWSRYVQKQSAELAFAQQDVEALSFVYVDELSKPGEWFSIASNLQAAWGLSGHMNGSVWFAIHFADQHIFFSGDYTEESLLLAAQLPTEIMAPMPRPDLSIIDAAHSIDPDSQELKLDRMRQHIEATLAAGGSVLLPVPQYGRGQELLVWAGLSFPNCPMLVEQELMNALNRIAAKKEGLKEGAYELILRLLNRDSVYVTESADQSLAIMKQHKRLIILTPDGMMQSAKPQWYYNQLCHSAANSVLLTGHLANGSYAKTLLQSTLRAYVPPQQHSVYSHQSESRCRIERIRYKVHQGLPDVRRMLQQLNSRHSVLVHAPAEQTNKLCRMLADEGLIGLHSLQPGDKLSF